MNLSWVLRQLPKIRAGITQGIPWYWLTGLKAYGSLVPLVADEGRGTSPAIMRQMIVNNIKIGFIQTQVRTTGAGSRDEALTTENKHHVRVKRELMIYLGWLRLLHAIAGDGTPAGGKNA